ncbi:molecular chaperone GrpE [Neolewinella xylanilytica]|uniref:Protein GrpE n=1 Tax=Neolewinella xylanilytica TaxID=1514080 RepID=A0A2S6IB81_9BACT|nr:nucleotide exchange factor GrpE [Neolewinella xylanilytica]PPK88722.1 molecular chaperone GrpE [Neolewinella xylanilytica]
MSQKKPDDPIVDDEMLSHSDAAPEEHTIEGDLKSDKDLQEDIPDTIDLDELQQRLEEKEDRYLRLYAEFDNYKRRTQRERLEMMDTAGSKTMKALLPVLDDFDRAAQLAEKDEQTAEIWNNGIGLVHKKLLSALASQGLKPMESTGKDYDSDLFEAVTEIPHPDMSGKVVDTLERGYTLNGRIIRHAKVVVGK